MNAAQLAQAITDRATQIKVRSASAAVDGWAGEIQDYAKQILTLAPTINERRKAGERRKKDKAGSLMRRVGARRGGVSVTIPPLVAVIETITVTSTQPATFDPTATHQITQQLKDRLGAVYDDRVVTYTSSDTNFATVTLNGGVVTAVAPGAVTITIKSEGITTTTGYTVTNPIASVTSVTVSPTSLSVTAGSTGQLTATAWDGAAGTGNIILGQTFTVQTNSDATKASTSVSSNVITVTGLVAGSTNITIRCSGVDATAVAVTVDATSGVVHALGIPFPNHPASMTLIIGGLYGSIEDDGGNTGVGTGGFRSTAYNPFYTRYCEGHDDMKENLFRTTDVSAPFQNARDTLYTADGTSGRGTSVGWYPLRPGTAGQQGYAQRATFPTTTTRWVNNSGVSLGFNQNWRRMYCRWVSKFLSDFPSHRLNKFHFFGNGTQDNSLLFTLNNAQGGSLTAPLGSMAWNLQGSPDNNLTAIPGDRGGLINATWTNGQINGGSAVVGGTDVFLFRGKWYSFEVEMWMNTYGQTDGWCKLWISELVSANPDVWTTPIAVYGTSGATGLSLQWNNAVSQQYWRSYQNTHQNQQVFNGNTRFAASSNFDIATTLAIPCQINGGSIFTLASGTVCDLGTTKVLAPNRWGSAKITTTAGGVLTALWTASDFASSIASITGMGTFPVTNEMEIGYITVLASASGWTAGTDALTGQTGGVPATTTNYFNRSGAYMALDYMALKTT